MRAEGRQRCTLGLRLARLFLSVGAYNGKIDFVDCAKLAIVWLEECSEPERCQGRDFDKNQKVDFADLKEMAESWLWQAGWYSH